MPGFQGPFKRTDTDASDAPRADDAPASNASPAASKSETTHSGSDSGPKRKRDETRTAPRDATPTGARKGAEALMDISLSEVSIGAGLERRESDGAGAEDGGVSETTKTRGAARSETPERDAMDDVWTTFHDSLKRAELAKRISSEDEVTNTVSEVRRVSERLRDLWSTNATKASDLARHMSQRCWNFAIEKTALETTAESGIVKKEMIGPLLDLRYFACELLDAALGFADGFAVSAGAPEISSLAVGISNHLTLAKLLHDAGEFKAAEEQFVIGESYGNSFLNRNGEFDAETMLQTIEAATSRAKNCFYLGNVAGARDFFQDAKSLSESEKNKGNETMCVTTLISAKINLAENFVVSEKLQSADDEAVFDRKVGFLVKELIAAYYDLFTITPNSWSTSSHQDNAAHFDLDEKLVCEDHRLVRADGLYIRILHNLARLFIHGRRYNEALKVLDKMKIIKSYAKKCENSDNVLARDLQALTESFLMDNMLIEAFSGSGEISKACSILENVLNDENSVVNVLHTCCVNLAKSECGAGAVASCIAPLAKRLSGCPKARRQEIITDIFEALLDTTLTVDEQVANDVLSYMDRLLTDTDSFKEIGFSRDGQSRAYAIIWNAASDMYMQNKYSLARKLFGMTLPLSSQRKSKTVSNAAVPVIRLQVMCDLENGDIEQAKESLRSLLADKTATDVSTTLLNVKFQLISDDVSGLGESIRTFAKAGESDALLYVAGELDGSKHHATAADAFRSLYDMILNNMGTDNMMKQETFIFCSYLRHVKMAKMGDFDSKTFSESAELFSEFMKRASNLNLLTDVRQARYLADFSWNTGLDAYEKSSETEAAYQFMFLCALVISKLNKIPEGLDADDRAEYGYRQAVALLLSIASLTSYNPATDVGDERSRKEREAKNIARSKGAMANLHSLLKNAEEERYEELRKVASVLEYEIACAQRDVALQGKIIEILSTKTLDDEASIHTLLMIADRGAAMRTSDLVTVSRAYEAVGKAMKKYLIQDVALIARLMRKRIQLASRVYKSKDDAIHSLYDSAEEFLALHPSYPPVEAQWLLSTCFNRAVRHERSMRTKEAIDWLKQTQKLISALEEILPDAVETYSSIINDNLAVLTVELDAA